MVVDFVIQKKIKKVVDLDTLDHLANQKGREARGVRGPWNKSMKILPSLKEWPAKFLFFFIVKNRDVNKMFVCGSMRWGS